MSLFFPLLTKALVIPDNGTGYIGELTPPQSYMSLSSSGNTYGAAVGVNNVVDYCSKNSAQWQSFLFPFPGSQEGEYGLKLYNKNVSEEENRENYLVAAINGIVSMRCIIRMDYLPRQKLLCVEEKRFLEQLSMRINLSIVTQCAGMVIYHV